jgi:nitroreductase
MTNNIEPMAAQLYDTMSTLRAVRRLRADPIPEQVRDRILQAAAWAPSGGNVQPWRLVVVENSERRSALGDLYRIEWDKYAVNYRKALKHLSGEVLAKQERMVAAADHLGEHMGEAPLILVFCFNPENMAITDADLGRPSVVGGGSVYPAVQNVMLACRAEGIGCTLTTLLCFQEPAVRELLGIPDPWYTCGFLPIGYPVLGGHGPISRRGVDKLCYLDGWGQGLNGD